jgi:hypothetical protein
LEVNPLLTSPKERNQTKKKIQSKSGTGSLSFGEGWGEEKNKKTNDTIIRINIKSRR